MDERVSERPWTVYVLTGWTLVGAVANLLTAGDNLVIPAIWFALGVLVASALWKGSHWAYTWAFMLTSLCVGFLLVISLVQFFLLEQTPARPVLVSLVTSGVMIALLLHPSTKSFARVDRDPSTAATV
jgi:hypothetical protein